MCALRSTMQYLFRFNIRTCVQNDIYWENVYLEIKIALGVNNDSKYVDLDLVDESYSYSNSKKY